MAQPPLGADQLTIRTLTDADLPAFSDVLASAFLMDHSDDFLAEERTVFEPSRSHAVFDGETMIAPDNSSTTRNHAASSCSGRAVLCGRTRTVHYGVEWSTLGIPSRSFPAM